MQGLLAQVAEGRVLICDGAMGTILQASGLGPGECPESWCVSHPDVVKNIAAAYFAAGADLVETNSFGATSLKLKSYGLSDKVEEFNRAAVELARAAAGDNRLVAASVGPTGQIVQEEGGSATSAELYAAFKEQIVVLAATGADAICIETMSSLIEAEQAIRAAKENTGLPVICTFTFQLGRRGPRTMMGGRPEDAAKAAHSAGADIIGANCGSGIDNIIDTTRQMRAACPQLPILVQPNAGAPVLENGRTIYKETPEYMASRVSELIAAGANIIGGCCGTSPDHIRAMARAVQEFLGDCLSKDR